MKIDLQHSLLIILISIQSTLYIFVPLRILVICTLIITCLFYPNIKTKIIMLTGVFIYLSLVFILFSVYHHECKPIEFLGILNINSTKPSDPFTHNNNTFYFVILPNYFSYIKLDTHKQAFSVEVDYLKMKTHLSSMLNLKTSRHFETSYMITLNKQLIYINIEDNKNENHERCSPDSNEQIMIEKNSLLSNLNIKSEDCILISITITEFDEFWVKYKMISNEIKMLRYIFKNICYETKYSNTRFDFAIFYANESFGFVKFRQKNVIKLIT